ncbi:MAG TPA: SigE family RNA polymerase sigma factor [Actinomycetes bacterium]|nr:SigE family RNA polymerase sigma factor [Actinomycetes bacterium]
MSEVSAVVERPWAGRSDAVATLFRTHHRRLVGLASLLCDDQATAEDVVQEAFAGLYRRWWQLRDPHSAVAYLNKAVVNGGRDHLRRRGRSDASLRRMVPQPEALSSAEQDVVSNDEATRLWQAIRQLPHRQRQVLVLRYYLDQSEAEIAETLGVARGSVKRHASRGLAALARTVEVAR